MTESTNPDEPGAEPVLTLRDGPDGAPLICDGVDCVSAIDQLYEYLDGQCQQTDREVIKEHLDDCSPCLKAFEFHQELHDLVKNHCKSELPDGLRDKVLGALKDLEFEQELLPE